MTPVIRDEREQDHHAVHAIHRAAFPGPEEAALVDALRGDADPLVSLVAELHAPMEQVIGHILFTPISIGQRGSSRPRAASGPLRFGLAPVGVLPRYQGQGIGSALITAGLDRCRALGAVGVVLLGDPGYYARFGFVAASRYGLVYEPVGEHPAFQALALAPNGFCAGDVWYHTAFDEV